MTNCKYEFQVQHFGFADITSTSFCKSQWRENRMAFLLYRLVAFGYAFGWIVGDVSKGDVKQNYIFLLTHWSLILGCVYFFLAILVILRDVCTKSDTDRGLKWFHKLVWLTFEVALSGSLITDLLFWALISKSRDTQSLLRPFSIHDHLISYVLLLIDLFINSIPIRLLHFPYCAGYGLIYMAFSLILHWTGVESAIYSYLDWERNSVLAIMVCMIASLVVLPFLHVIHFGLYRLRLFISRRCLRKDNLMDDISNEQPTKIYGHNNTLMNNNSPNKETRKFLNV